jgi:hypothetical protein
MLTFLPHFGNQCLVIILLLRESILCLKQFLLCAINLIIEVVDQLLFIHLLLVRSRRKLFCSNNFVLKILYLVFVPLNNFLAKMRPLCQLAFDLLVV